MFSDIEKQTLSLLSSFLKLAWYIPQKDLAVGCGIGKDGLENADPAHRISTELIVAKSLLEVAVFPLDTYHKIVKNLLLEEKERKV